jgi:HNH endonuclease
MHCCEYCLTAQADRTADFAIDHIIAEKHGGETDSNNLCLSCYWCNSYKGSDVASIDWSANEEVVQLFHPRRQAWADHFQLEGARIKPLTATGRVTVFLLRFNADERLEERELLLELGRYPCTKTGS